MVNMAQLFTSINECRRSPQGECTFHQKTTINKITLLLIGIELFFVFVFALAGPFVSVFIIKGVSSATVSIVEIASMIFLATKSTFQIPISRIVDRTASENSDEIGASYRYCWHYFNYCRIYFTASI